MSASESADVSTSAAAAGTQIFKYLLHSPGEPTPQQHLGRIPGFFPTKKTSLFPFRRRIQRRHRRAGDCRGGPDAASRHLRRSDYAPLVLVRVSSSSSFFFFNCHFGVVVTLRNRRYEGEDRSGVKGMKGGLKRRGGGRWRDAGRPSPRKRR